MWKEAPVKNCGGRAAKAMWWRNPWLLKLTRITLNPAHKSLRGQAKKEGLATIEAVAIALECLGENAVVGESLRKQYEEFIIMPNLMIQEGVTTFLLKRR